MEKKQSDESLQPIQQTTNEKLCNRRKSKTRTSGTSLGSVGIGGANKDYLVYRLTPEGVTHTTSSLYDCVMFIIYCPEHDKILLNNNERTKIAFLPFVILRDGVTWDKASVEGVDAIIGRKMDTEMDPKLAEKIRPKYRMSYLHILRIQSSTERYYTRITQFVHLLKSDGFQCCVKMQTLDWFKASDILHEKIDNCWSTEINSLTSMMVNKDHKMIEEYPLECAFRMLTCKKYGNQAMLLQNKIKAEHVIEIYEDYLCHCYPAYYMSYRSFKSYLVKYGYEKSDRRLRYLFNACQQKPSSYITFDEFIIAMVATEPTCSNMMEARIRFVFRYYDIDKNGNLSCDEFVALLQDINPKMDKKELALYAENKASSVGIKNGHIRFEDFKKAVENGSLDLGDVCKGKKSTIVQISRLLKLKQKKTDEISVSEMKHERNKCLQCSRPNYKYGANLVTIDTEGCCVQPKSQILLNDDDYEESNERKFSAEIVFNTNSIPNILIELIKMYHNVGYDSQAGLMSDKTEHANLLHYTQTLCEYIKGIMLNEKKLIHINAPAFIIGDIRGSLTSLLRIESQCFPSFPVIAENLVFLGNYSGEMKDGVECLLFVFSLKVILPNKVFLLRGIHEAVLHHSERFLIQCIHKYGEKTGRAMFLMLEEIWDHLQLALVVDETILCVHSGFPNNCHLDKLLELNNSLHSIENIAYFAYEILSTYPKPKNKKSKTSLARPGDPNYHRHIFSQQSQNSALCKSIKSKLISKSIDSLKRSKNKSRKYLKSKSHSHPKLSRTGSQTKSTKSSLDKNSSVTVVKTASFVNKMSSKSRASLASLPLSDLMVQFNSRISNPSVISDKTKMKLADLRSKDSIVSSSEIISKSTQKLNVKSSGLSRTSTNKPKPKNRKHEILKHTSTFDIKSFSIFLKYNDFRFLIRSSSVCSHGYKLNFRGKCLTVFSCSGLLSPKDKAAVIQINRSTSQIRFLVLGD